MRLTQSDRHIYRVLFKKDTHDMALALYGERAKVIYHYIRRIALHRKGFFEYIRVGHAFEEILEQEPSASFFFDNNLIDFGCLGGSDIHGILKWSPIAEKIWDSAKLDAYLNKLDAYHIKLLLEESPIKDKIKASGKLSLK